MQNDITGNAGSIRVLKIKLKVNFLTKRNELCGKINDVL